MTTLQRKSFLIDIVEIFPSLARSIEEQRAELSFEVEVIIQHIQKTINKPDHGKSKQVLELLNKYYLLGEPELSSLIRNAVCENLNFEDTKKNVRSYALEYLSVPLKKERDTWRTYIGGQ